MPCNCFAHLAMMDVGIVAPVVRITTAVVGRAAGLITACVESLISPWRPEKLPDMALSVVISENRVHSPPILGLTLYSRYSLPAHLPKLYFLLSSDNHQRRTT